MQMRTTMILATLGHAFVAFCSCLALVVLTSVMRVQADALGESLDSERSAMSVETSLLLHRVTSDETVRSTEGSSLLASVDSLQEEAPRKLSRLSVDLSDKVKRYLAATDPIARDAAFATSLAAAHRLALSAADRGRDLEAAAAQTDVLGNVLGIAMAVLLALSVTGYSLWLWKGAFRPVERLRVAMSRFAGGDLHARADESGSSDFAAMGRAFNLAVSSLDRAHHDQLKFTGSLLHDLRTPLSAIQLATQFVADDKPLPPDARVRELFASVKRQVVRLNGIVGDGLGVLRAESGDMDLRLERCDLSPLVQECVELFRSISPGHVFELHVPDSPATCHCDVARIEQVVNNLLSNAVKYSPKGSRIRTRVLALPTHVEIDVEDQGRGISPEQRERIFEPFQRSGSAHEEVPGVGLGLYVSRSVVEAHGGSIEVDSNVGKGSRFRVRLPCAEHVPLTVPQNHARHPAGR